MHHSDSTIITDKLFHVLRSVKSFLLHIRINPVGLGSSADSELRTDKTFDT